MPNEFIVKNGLISQGNITISGSITATGGVTVSGSIASASYASNAELLDGLDSTVFTLTSSFNAQTASFTAFTSSMNSFSASILTNVTALNAKTASFATTGSNTFVGAEVISGSLAISGSGTPFTLNTDTLEITGSLIVTGSTTLTGSLLQLGNFTTTGTIIAQTINVQTVTSSIVYSSGSNVFGNSLGNSQTFTGSVLITGSLTIAGASSATSYNGATIFGSTIACSPIGCFATSCATSFIGGTMSGTTIYGSTAVCSPVGKFTTCLDLGGALTGTSATFNHNDAPTIRVQRNGGTDSNTVIEFTNASCSFYIGSNGTVMGLGGTTGAIGSQPLQIASTGAATFSSTITGTTIYGSTAVCSPVGKFTSCIDITSAATTGTALRINGDNLTTGTALSIVSNDGSASHTGNLVEICNAFNAGAAAKLMCLYQGDDGDGIYINMARGGVGLTVDGAGGGYSAIFNNGNVGIGTTAPSMKLSIGDGTGTSNQYIRMFSSATDMYIGQSASLFGLGVIQAIVTDSTYNNAFGIGTLSNTACLVFATNNIPRITITGGGNVGIGSCTPGDLLHVEKCQAGGMGMIIRNSCGATSNTSMCSLISLQLVGVGQTGQLGVNLIAGKEGDYSSAGVRNAFFAIQTACGDNLYERLRITSGGIVGIGTGNVLSWYNSGYTALQIGGMAGVFSNTSNTSITGGLTMAYNIYVDSAGNYQYMNTTNARAGSTMVMEGGDIYFSNAAAGTGANPTVTERMRITSGGSTCFYGTVLSTAPSNGYNFRGLGFSTGAIATGGSCLIYSSLDRGLYLISIASSVTSTFGYSAFLWVDSSNIAVSSVIRQECVTISTSGRALCVVNQYGSETAIMTVTTLNLLNYIG